MCLAVLLASVAGAQTHTNVTPAAMDVCEAVRMLERRGLQAQSDVLSRRLLEGVVRTVDTGGWVATPRDFEAFLKERGGWQRGLGAEWTVTNGQSVAEAVPAGTPAARAGLKPGDVLDSIDGRYVTGVPPARRDEWIRSATNDKVRLAVIRKGAKQAKEFDVAIDWIRRPAVTRQETLPRRIGLIQLAGIWSGAATAVEKTLQGWERESMTGAVLDLRGAAGDDLEEAIRLAGVLAPPGTALPMPVERAATNDAVRLTPTNAASLRLPVMLLVGPATSGAAEWVAAVLENSGGGRLLVGRPTAGDPLIREGLPFGTNRMLYVATRRLSGREIEGNGDASEPVRPHIIVADGAAPADEPASEDDVMDLNPRRRDLAIEKEDRALRQRVKHDAALQRAVDVLLGLQALRPSARSP